MDVPTWVGITYVADLFCAHRDAYVADSRRHVAEPITEQVLYDAYKNGHAISGYTARQQGDRMLTHVGAIDFDHSDMETISRVRETAHLVGIPTLLSNSRRGAHLWVVVKAADGTHGSEPFGDIPASSLQKALAHVIRLTDAVSPTEVEIFPKTSASPWGVGALRLPLMTHPKTGKRYPCIDMEGNVLTKLIDVVCAVQFADWPTIYRLAQEAPVEYPRQLGEYRKQVRRDAGSAVSLLAQMGTQAQPGRSCRCPFHDDSKASLSVADDDERVWCKSPECVAYNMGRGVGTIMLAALIAKVRG